MEHSYVVQSYMFINNPDNKVECTLNEFTLDIKLGEVSYSPECHVVCALAAKKLMAFLDALGKVSPAGQET